MFGRSGSEALSHTVSSLNPEAFFSCWLKHLRRKIWLFSCRWLEVSPGFQKYQTFFSCCNFVENLLATLCRNGSMCWWWTNLGLFVPWLDSSDNQLTWLSTSQVVCKNQAFLSFLTIFAQIPLKKVLAKVKKASAWSTAAASSETTTVWTPHARVIHPSTLLLVFPLFWTTADWLITADSFALLLKC